MSRMVSTLFGEHVREGVEQQSFMMAALHMACVHARHRGVACPRGCFRYCRFRLIIIHAQANSCHKAAVPGQLTETRSRLHNSRLRAEWRRGQQTTSRRTLTD